MISDEELKRAAECDIESEVTQFCVVIGLSVIDPKVMLEAGNKTQEMARELLTYREEKRKAEEAREAAWKRLPKWVQWKATDRDGVVFLHENKPIRHQHEWVSLTYEGRVIKFVGPVLDWKDTLEERP